MTTPGDVARMLRHADSRLKYASTSPEKEQEIAISADEMLQLEQMARSMKATRTHTDGPTETSQIHSDGVATRRDTPKPKPFPKPAPPRSARPTNSTSDAAGTPSIPKPAPPKIVVSKPAAPPAPPKPAPPLTGPTRKNAPLVPKPTSPARPAPPRPADNTPAPVSPASRALPRHVATDATPAALAGSHRSAPPASFASLEAHDDLPVVREYSAGGLIFDENDRVAVIARHSRSGHLEWCLPKGHIEKGETPEQTAVREVREETGIDGIVVESIATIDYWFTGSTQRIHKLVHHFALARTGGHLTTEDDPDHEAEDVKWVDFADLPHVLSYPNERRIALMYARKRQERR